MFIIIFVILFVMVIVIMKDFFDIEGDKKFNILIFVINLGVWKIFFFGVGFFLVNYIGVIVVVFYLF